jgi:NitT/TauT family transport system substrate-binding protein
MIERSRVFQALPRGAANMKYKAIIFAALLAAVMLGSIDRTRAEDKIRLGILPFSESLGAVLADKEGFFKADGIEVEMTKFNGGPLMLPVLQAGKLDVAFTNTISTLQALEQGFDATILAPGAKARSHAPDSTSALLVLKGPIHTVKDLKGKRIAINVINSTAWMYVIALLDNFGVDRNDVRFVEVPFPQMNAPLLNDQVDAIFQVEPFRTVIEDTGKVYALAYPYVDVQPNADITQYIALTSWVNKNPDLAKRFARAIIKGAEFANAHEAVTREVNQQFTNLAPEFKDRVTLPILGDSVDVAELNKTMGLMVKYGLLQKPVDLTGRVLSVQ